MAVEGVKGAKGHGIGVAEYGPGTGGQAAVGVGSLDSAFHGVFCTDDVGGVYGNPNLGARVQECLGAKTCGQVGAPGGQDCGFSVALLPEQAGGQKSHLFGVYGYRGVFFRGTVHQDQRNLGLQGLKIGDVPGGCAAYDDRVVAVFYDAVGMFLQGIVFIGLYHKLTVEVQLAYDFLKAGQE